MTEDIVVRFVTNTEICKVPSQMKKAFEVAKYQFNSDCDWINTENAFKIAKRLTTKSIIFIANPTEIDDFSMLIQKRKKLYGPLVILYCNKNNMVMPRIKSKPIFSLTLNGLIICCSTMDEERRNNIYNKVEMMGGLFSQALTENVTHLVSAISGSKKYYVAINYNKKIMSPTWVEKLWESVCDYRDPKYNEFPFSEMKCPIFSGCIMSVSGFVSIDKIKLKELIETNGGEYSAKMKKNFCTHLIVLEAKGLLIFNLYIFGVNFFVP
ncbi:hypothetical protein A3Q56_03334 [Intoshia linei]|uniref:BRCT domain-containing protein n=1 Tax=Intoshia linei TaxID=1819745 RepID=A0A177B443_9BILA|nr:hypothetical protein A3Q56_03334 [Intoshia linei]